MSKTDQNAKTKLAELMASLQPIIDAKISEMNSSEVNHILTNYKQYLKVDLARDFEQARETALKDSPFDDLLNN